VIGPGQRQHHRPGRRGGRRPTRMTTMVTTAITSLVFSLNFYRILFEPPKLCKILVKIDDFIAFRSNPIFWCQRYRTRQCKTSLPI
jgi:hypothetical protein